jgi:hypothetical protein
LGMQAARLWLQRMIREHNRAMLQRDERSEP